MKIPDIIYHYTTKETFLKIFSSKNPELRMYPVNQMNDPMECKWLFHNLLELHLIPQDHPILSKEAILEQINRGLIISKTLKNYLHLLHKMPHFLGSFTKNSGIENGLTFWREYAQQGTGLAIGIAHQHLIKHNPQLYYGSVFYKSEQKVTEIWESLYYSSIQIGSQIYEAITNNKEYTKTEFNKDIDKEILQNPFLKEFFESTNILTFMHNESQNIYKEYDFNLIDIPNTQLISVITSIHNFVFKYCIY